MLQYTEKRSDLRKNHKSPVMIEDPEGAVTYRARMMNYSKNGLLLETNAVFDPGKKVHIGIENSPFRASTYQEPDGYIAEIIWQSGLEDTIFTSAYGVKLVSTKILLNGPVRKRQADPDVRNHPRRPYRKLVYFTSENQYYKGILKNLSRGGAFIETNGQLAMGQIIKLVIPGTKIDKGVMLKSVIIHSLPDGVGIRFKRILKSKTK
jgi:Tfp pilus assembly protein PilZ